MRAQSVTRVDWKNPMLLRQMPRDISLLLGEEDINHLNNILQDDQNDFTFFHQLGLLSAYLEVAPLGSDDLIHIGGSLELHIHLHSSVQMVVKIFSPRKAKKTRTPMYMQ